MDNTLDIRVTPYFDVCSTKHEPMAPTDWKEIMQILESDDIPELRSFITHHGGPEVCFNQSYNNNTILTLAEKYSSMDMYNAVLDMGADPNSLYILDIESSGDTIHNPLLLQNGTKWSYFLLMALITSQSTVSSKRRDMILACLAHGANPNVIAAPKWCVVDENLPDMDMDLSLFDITLQSFDDEINAAILQHCDVHFINTDRKLFVPKLSLTECVSIRKGCDAEALREAQVIKSLDQVTLAISVLHTAVFRKLESTCSILIGKFGADVNRVCPKCNVTPLRMATVHELRSPIAPQTNNINRGICSTLLNAGANPYATNNVSPDSFIRALDMSYSDVPELIDTLNAHCLARRRIAVIRVYEKKLKFPLEVLHNIAWFCLPPTSTIPRSEPRRYYDEQWRL